MYIFVENLIIKNRLVEAIMVDKSDEDVIRLYRSKDINDTQRSKIFNTLLSRRRGDKDSWQTIITKYVRWRLSRSRKGFDIYDEDDLIQRCLCCFYRAVSERFDFSFEVKFSTYIYTALKNTVDRVVVELRKKKRTIEIDGKRISPKYFTSSLQQPIGDDEKSMILGDIITESNDDLSDDEFMLAELITQKCERYLTPMQFEIFMRGDIQGITSGKELAQKYDKSEPTISAMKKRKIAKALKRIRTEMIDEFKIAKFS